MRELLLQSSTNNIYDFYKSLYLQRLEKHDIEEESISTPAEEDKEFLLWNYTNLRYEQDGRKPISILETPKEKWDDLINEYMISEVDDENEPNDLENIIKNSNFENKTYPYKDYENKLKEYRSVPN